MNSRERVLTALRREEPDRVPIVENDVEESLQVQIMKRNDYMPGELADVLGLDAFGFHYPSGQRGGTGQSMQGKEAFHSSYYYPEQITFDFVPPWIAEMGQDHEGRSYIVKGLLVNSKSLDLFSENLPDPHHPSRYDQVSEWIHRYKGDRAVFARIRLGAASTINSMGLETLSYALYDEPDLVKEIHLRFSTWMAEVLEYLNKMDFDFFWANDDIADNKGPWFSPSLFREFFLPSMKIVSNAIKKPWIYHSDGNLFPILPELLTLGMDGIHPIQPAAMDMARMKKEYGDRVCIVGNIDLDYTLTRACREEVIEEVRQRIKEAGPGGGYMVSSANSLTGYCKLENVLAIREAVERYGSYPL